MSGYIDWRGARHYAERAHAVLDVLDSLVDGGLAAEVVLLAEHAMKRLDTAMGRIDDSSGYLGSVLERVADIHYDACVAARPDPRKLAVRLVELPLKSDWEWFLDAPERYAEVLGADGLDAYRARLEREWEALPALGPSPQRMFGHYDGHRSRITFLRLSLARAGGSVDEVVSVLAHDLSSPYDFCKIADELEGASREREALAWLERGLAAFPPAGDRRLRGQAVRAYRRDGQVEDALALVERAFDADPSASTYGELREVASELPGWNGRRREALDRLRGLENTRRAFGMLGGRSDAVRAQLDEGDVGGAWLDAQEGGCTAGLWRELADARRASHPDEAVSVYRHQLAGALEHSAVGAYREAIELLCAIRDTLVPLGRRNEVTAEVEQIRTEYRRRPKLVSMLDGEEW